jgi:hypothetical protein
MRSPFTGPELLDPPEALLSALTPQPVAATATASTAVMLVNQVRALTADSFFVVRLAVSVP